MQSPGGRSAQRKHAGSLVAGVKVDDATGTGEAFQKAADGGNHFAGLFKIDPGQISFELRLKADVRVGPVRLIEDEPADDLVQVNALGTRRNGAGQGQSIVEDPAALGHQLAEAVHLLQYAGVSLRKRQFQIIGDRFHSAEGLAQFVRNFIEQIFVGFGHRQ
jgi:hypothetical protein